MSNATAPAASTTSSNLYPALFYRDAAAAIAWLARAFGFVERVTMPGPDGTIAHAEMSIGPGVIMLGTAKPEKGWVSPLDLSATSQTVCVHVADIDAHYARACAAGAEIVTTLHDTSYGSRGYDCRDCEGHFWSFGTYVPGAYWAS